MAKKDGRKTGKVRWFDEQKGYGFIAVDGERDEMFVHFSGIRGDGHRTLSEGDVVSFEIEASKRDGRPQAVDVVVD